MVVKRRSLAPRPRAVDNSVGLFCFTIVAVSRILAMADEDFDLTHFAADGLSLPPGGTEHRVTHDGASIWCASYGRGAAGR